MATPRVALKLKRLRQRFGISAPKLAIRTHVAWYWRALAMISVLSISLALGSWIYDAGRRIAGHDSSASDREIQSLRNYVMELDAELTKLRSVAGTGESSLAIERAAQQQLSRQVRALEQENAVLKEDLAFFEGLVPSSALGDEPGVRIDRLRIDPEGKHGEFRYRMLIINNTGRQGKEMKGKLQLGVRVQLNGKDAMISVPSDADPNPQRFYLEINRFRRVEGLFSVPEGAVVKGVEARLIQDGAVRAKQSVNL